jgi:hypothetical protein
MASPSATPRHVVVNFLVQALQQQPCVCFVVHVPGGVRHETSGVLVAATGSTFCLECERRSIEAERLMEQREVGGGHLDLDALPAACGRLCPAFAWAHCPGSIIRMAATPRATRRVRAGGARYCLWYCLWL